MLHPMVMLSHEVAVLMGDGTCTLVWNAAGRSVAATANSRRFSTTGHIPMTHEAVMVCKLKCAVQLCDLGHLPVSLISLSNRSIPHAMPAMAPLLGEGGMAPQSPDRPGAAGRAPRLNFMLACTCRPGPLKFRKKRPPALGEGEGLKIVTH